MGGWAFVQKHPKQVLSLLHFQPSPEIKVEKKPLVFSRKPKTSFTALYYTDNQLEGKIMEACQRQLLKSIGTQLLVSVSLKPLDFGHNIVLNLERGYLTMFKQILIGLENCHSEVVFLCEHDVLYHPSHFEFVPPRQDKVYYNTNCWHLRSTDGHCLYYTAKRLSQLTAYREVLIEHYQKRIEKVEREGFTYKIGFEPGTHNRPQKVDDLKCGVFVSAFPNIDIKHGRNLTKARWNISEFRNKNSCPDWQEANSVPGWEKFEGNFLGFLTTLL